MQIPTAVPNLGGNEAAYLLDCIASTFVSSVGPYVKRFETAIAALSGTPDAAVVSSGTVALQMALQALGVGAGDLVLVPSLTFIATANAVRHSGAEVWLIDSDPELWSIDLDLCRERIIAETEPVPGGRRHRATGRMLKAIMPVMIMGSSLDFAALAALGRDFGLKIVVDAAAAIGAHHRQGAGCVPIGAAGVDAVCYSFNGNKTITCGGGGAVAAADAALIDRIRHMTTTGRVGRDYDHDIVAYNFRMTNVQAAIGVAQLEQLDGFLRRKREIRDHYARLAGRYPCLAAFPEPPHGTNTCWFSGFFYKGDRLGLCDDFRAHMNAAGVDLRRFWKPVHLQLPYAGAPATAMPCAGALWPRIFPLPCSTHLAAADLAHVTDAAAAFWDRAVD